MLRTRSNRGMSKKLDNSVIRTLETVSNEAKYGAGGAPKGGVSLLIPLYCVDRVAITNRRRQPRRQPFAICLVYIMRL